MNQRKLRIANFVTDEKFVDSTIGLLSLTPDRAQHDFFLCPYWKIDFHYIWKVNFKYIKAKESVRLIAKKNILNLLKEENYDVVILHSLDSMPYDIIASIPKKIKVLWLAWGYDLYGENKVVQIDQYKPFTKAAIKTDSIALKLKKQLKKLLDLEQDGKYASAVNRIDFFSGCLPAEYNLCTGCSFFQAKQVDFRYQGPNEFVKDFCFSEGENILIGNSANPTGNHLDILPYFEGIDIGCRKIVVPLSYAGPEYYIAKVKEAYFKRFGTSCIFLDGFMPIEEYSVLIDSCNIGIFYHERQQALGNINFILKRGGKVFLSETSVVYKEYKSKGCNIYALQKDLNQVAVDQKLDEKKQLENLDFVASSRTLKVKLERLNRIYDTIESC